MADEPNIEGAQVDSETGFILMQPDQAAAVFGAAGGGVTVHQVGPNEAKRRRKDVKTSVCDQIELCGQQWYVVRHRTQIRANFDGDAPTAQVVDGLDEETRQLGKNLLESLNIEGLEDVSSGYLLLDATVPHLFALAKHLLLKNYELSNDELSYLLSIQKDSTWPSAIVRWAMAYDPNVDVPIDESLPYTQDTVSEIIKNIPITTDVRPEGRLRRWLNALRFRST